MPRRYTAEKACQLISEALSNSESDESDFEELVSDDETSSSASSKSNEDSEDDSLSEPENSEDFENDENIPVTSARVIASDKSWTDAKVRDNGPKLIRFLSEGSSGPTNIDNCHKAIDYFHLFFTDEIIQEIVDEMKTQSAIVECPAENLFETLQKIEKQAHLGKNAQDFIRKNTPNINKIFAELK